METLYWLFQYAYVLIAFVFVMFIWPMVVFRKYLKGKSRTFRFSFSYLIMIMIINTVCITLGLLHVLNQAIYCLLFYGVFLYSVFKGKKVPQTVIKRLKSLIGGTYKPKSMFLDIFRFLKKKLKEFWAFFKRFMKGHWGVYILLGIVVLWGYTYFSYAALKDFSFGCGDVYVHCEWVYRLFEGKIFYAGIYPEAMHFCIFSTSALSGVQMYSAILFTQSINVFVMLVAMYMLFREFFKWKYSPIIALMLFLTVNVCDANEVYTLSRMQWSLPQEFGYPAMFMCAAFLIRYLRYSVVKKKDKAQKEQEKKSLKIPFIKKTLRFRLPICFKDDNLLLFMLSLACTLAIHFYATIMAFLFCVGITIALIRRLFSRKFLPLVVSIIIGFMVAVVPMVVSFMTGIGLQGSLYWAMSVFMPKSETETVQTDTQTQTAEEATDSNEAQSGDGSATNKETEEKVSADKSVDYKVTNDIVNENVEESMTSVSGIGNPVAAKTITGSTNVFMAGTKIIEFFETFLKRLLKESYQPLHGKESGEFYYYSTLFTLLLGIAACLLSLIITKIKKAKFTEGKTYVGYVILAGIGIMCHFFKITPAYGIPCIMEPYRIYGIAFMTGVITIAVPIDCLFGLFMKKMHAVVSVIFGSIFVIAVYVTCLVTGRFRGYLVYQLTRYNSSVNLTNQIVNSLPKDKYTIVSSTDELFQIIGHGFHEELVEFYNQAEVVSYTIPTDYIFIFVEKNAIQRNQDHFVTGPSWFAQNTRYYRTMPGKNSEGDNLRKQTIDEKLANVYFGAMPHSINVYGKLWQRVVLNSKMYVWCQRFNAMYPNELHVYYEDEDLVCYYLHQNPRNLYELAAMDPSVMISPDEYDNPIWPADYAKRIRYSRWRLGEISDDELTDEEKEEWGVETK